MIGPRVLSIGYDCDPIDEATAQERLKSISSFVRVHTQGVPKPYRWELKISLHPIIQNRTAKEMVSEINQKLGVPPMTFLAWHDTMEDGP